MEIRFNVTGARRKELALMAGEIIGEDPIYKGPPTFAYGIGGFTLDKNGTLTYDSTTDISLAEMLIEQLAERGFDLEVLTENLVIGMPVEAFTEQALENLKRLIASKAGLIKKAIGTHELPVERTETALQFPWFRADASSEEVTAYTRFVSALCAVAKEQKRVTAKEKPVGSEKFAFRVFLIKLGFVGDEFKRARKILLRNLSGSSAYAKPTGNQ